MVDASADNENGALLGGRAFHLRNRFVATDLALEAFCIVPIVSGTVTGLLSEKTGGSIIGPENGGGGEPRVIKF